MVIVNCTKEYWEFVRLLRNDERVIDGFIDRIEITKEQQEKYMSSNQHNYRIALVEGKPAGYVGVIEDDIRVCTSPEFQGKGVGKYMINECKKLWPKACAKVKHANLKSHKLFLSCGFQELNRDENFIYYKK